MASTLMTVKAIGGRGVLPQLQKVLCFQCINSTCSHSPTSHPTRHVWVGRIASICRNLLGRRAEHVALPLISDVNLFGNCERIIHFNAEVASRALDLSVTKKKLDGS